MAAAALSAIPWSISRWVTTALSSAAIVTDGLF
jgi:hypothetical protein